MAVGNFHLDWYRSTYYRYFVVGRSLISSGGWRRTDRRSAPGRCHNELIDYLDQKRILWYYTWRRQAASARIWCTARQTATTTTFEGIDQQHIFTRTSTTYTHTHTHNEISCFPSRYQFASSYPGIYTAIRLWPRLRTRQSLSWLRDQTTRKGTRFTVSERHCCFLGGSGRRRPFNLIIVAYLFFNS